MDLVCVMPNIRDLYRLDTSGLPGLLEAQIILLSYSFDSEFIDWVMMVLRANNRLTEDARKEPASLRSLRRDISDLEEENVRLEQKIVRLERKVA